MKVNLKSVQLSLEIPGSRWLPGISLVSKPNIPVHLLSLISPAPPPPPPLLLASCPNRLHLHPVATLLLPTPEQTHQVYVQPVAYTCRLNITVFLLQHAWISALCFFFFSFLACAWSCRESVRWKSGGQWWRGYWLVGQAPEVSTQ